MSITDREYLTFCNATNLEWQFSEINKKSRKDNKGKYVLRYPYVHELLTPASFYREIKNAKTNRNEKTYIYGSNGTDKYDQTKGLIEMRKKSGVLMNYLEECGKNSGEGDFLKDWEARGAVNN